jgi:hypothetical protein
MPHSNLQNSIIKYSSVLVLLHSVIALIYNLNQLLLTEGGSPFYQYMQNDQIRLIYYISTIIIILFCILCYIKINSLIKFSNWFYLIFYFLISLFMVFLIWFEIYYGSTFYYGEVRDKHHVFGLANALGVKGSTIYPGYVLLLVMFKNSKYLYLKIIISIGLIFVWYYSQVYFYKFMEEPWRLWLS